VQTVQGSRHLCRQIQAALNLARQSCCTVLHKSTHAIGCLGRLNCGEAFLHSASTERHGKFCCFFFRFPWLSYSGEIGIGFYTDPSRNN
jgi:hypothetical protein